MSDRDAAFEAYFAARSDALRGTAYLLCGDWHRAEDLVQQTFTKLYLVWRRIQRHEAMDNYTRQTLIRTFLSERRRGWFRLESVDATPYERSAPTTRKSNDPWPEGQSDRTATTGPRADRSVTLMNDLSSMVPGGFTTPDLKYPDGRAMRWPQTQYASNDGEQDSWEYRALIPVQQANRVGTLLARSTTPDGKPATAPCKLVQRADTGTCTVVDVNGRKVGVLTTKTGDQWAAYRHPDGTVVHVSQSRKSDNPKYPALTAPIFTPEQLAELATSEKLKISE
ncbi:sigma factor [Kribbella sp. NPDC051770]|uniref:sigma factor n=1 Tax=Kribbella sp. NPDC051770 TaxID=3155413 RepID=UPI00341B53E6